MACGSTIGWGQAQIRIPKWVQDQIVNRIELTGYRRLGFHAHSISGDRNSYDSLTNSGQGLRNFTDQGVIGVTGRKVLNVLDFDFTILDSRFTDPQGQKFTIDTTFKGLRAQIGDIQGSIGGGLTSLNKTVRGAQVQFRSGRWSSKALYSAARGSARSVTLQGNNTAGPYYLQNSQIVQGSEQVRLDDQPLQIQRDYTINYELGSITLVNRIVPPTSSLVVTFEALGFNADAATVGGLEFAYDMGRWGSIGVAGVRQSSASGTRLNQVVEKFQGFGAPSTPYFLQFEPLLTRPILVRVNGIDQAPGIDYRFDTQNPSIFYFQRFMPASSNIDVFYTPKPRGTANGDRESWGLSYRLPLGKNKNGELSLAQSTGRQKSDVSPLSGTARSAGLRYETGGWRFTGVLRDIPQGYVTVESRGFSRNEKATEWTLARSLVKGLEFEFGHTNSAIRSRNASSNGSLAFTGSRFASARLGARYRPTTGGPWTLEARQTKSRSGTRNSTLEVVTLGTTQAWSRFRLGVDVSSQSGTGRSPEGESGRVTLQSVDLRTGYTPSSDLTFRGTASLSRIQSGGASGIGTDASVNATYRPGAAWQFGADYALSDSGKLSSLGFFDGGFGLGYEGSGFNSGIPSGTPVGASNSRLLRFSASYQDPNGLAVTGSAQSNRSTGSVTANAETVSYSLAASSPLGRSHQVAMSLDSSRTQYEDSLNRLTSTTFNLFFEGSPSSRLSWRAGASFLISGGNEDFGQDSTAFESLLVYRLGRRQSLSFFANWGSTRGYLPQDDLDATLTYSYQVWGNLALNASYRFRNLQNRDPLIQSGAYRASGFDLTLNFQFGR